MNSKLEESNKKKKRNALAEKIFLAKINYGYKATYALIEECIKAADMFIKYSNE